MPGRKKRTIEDILEQSISDAEQKEEEQGQIVELLPANQVEIMSMSELYQEKQALAQRRNQIMLKLDKRKLKQAEMIMDAMDYALNRMIGRFNEDGEIEEMDAMSFKMMTDGYKNLLDCLNKISRLDSVDSGGKAGRISIEVKYRSD